MSDDSKSREELLEELAALRKQISDQTTIEVMLKAERERCQEYLDLAGVMFVAIDTVGTVILANRKACEVLEYEENEIVGKNWFDNFLPQRLRERGKQVFEQLISGEIEPIEYFENPVLPKSGVERFIAWHSSILRDDKGNIVASLSSGEDITERKQMEKSLRESEGRFRAIMASTIDFIFTKDNEFRYTYVNRAMADLFGCNPEDLIGRTPEELFDPEYAKVVYEVDKLVLKGEIVDQTRVLSIGGQEYDFHTVQVPLADADGKVEGICGIVRDITEMKKTEEALRDNKERFEKIIAQCPIPMVITDAEGDIEYFNDRFIEVFGYTLDDVSTTEQWWALTYPDEDYRQLVRRSWESAIAVAAEKGTQIETQEWDFTCKDRSVRHVEFDMMPLGAISVIAMNDITERKRTEEKLRQSYDFMQTVIDGFPEDLMVINRDYTIALANSTVRLKAGNDPVVSCMKCHQISHHSETPCENGVHPCPLLAVFETEKLMEVEHIHYDKLGNEKIVEVVVAPIFDQHGDVVQVIESCRDITERRNAEEERLYLERQIQHAQKLESLGVLAGGIAHDFNNILMAILGNADLALQDLSTANPAYANVKEIEIASLRAADLARQMLAYSGKGKFLIEKISLNEAVEEMTHMLEVSISKKAVIKYHYSDNLPLIDADATQIRQIIMNLVLNASDAIERTSGVISITTGAMDCDNAYLTSAYIDESLPEGQYVYVEVTDTGSGMDSETMEKLFDPFYTTKFTGRGLGLSAVLGIIRGHSGAIRVYSELGKGSSIKVLFPACSDPAEALETDHREKGIQWTCSGTILLVDDEDSILSVERQMLERIGFDILTASDGREALSHFREHSDVIDLVILDLTMPHVDGEEAFRELRRVRDDVRVLITSGYNEQEVCQRFSDKSLAGFLQKPFTFSELEGKIKEIFDN
ncbi:MAG: PAS domain S-box protein [Candidatus Aegiribacteria sp.]|nr:PAS domain S-box protein [Candidatus Aegiribacteria sp.]